MHDSPRYRNCKFHNGCRTISRRADAINVPADSASEVVKFTISIPRESCTNTKAKYSSSVVPPDPSVHSYHCPTVTLSSLCSNCQVSCTTQHTAVLVIFPLSHQSWPGGRHNGYSTGLATQKVTRSNLGHSTFRQQPWASCTHTCASVTKQYNLVPV